VVTKENLGEPKERLNEKIHKLQLLSGNLCHTVKSTLPIAASTGNLDKIERLVVQHLILTASRPYGLTGSVVRASVFLCKERVNVGNSLVVDQYVSQSKEISLFQWSHYILIVWTN